MNFKKIMIKGVAFAFALSCISFAAPQSAKAEDVEYAFVGGAEKITTTKYKFWGVAKEVDAKKADITIGDKYYRLDEIAPVENDTINISFLNKKKVNIIALGEVESFTDNTKPWIVKTIDAQNTNFKAAFLKLEGDKVTVGGKEVVKGSTYSDADLGAFAAVNGDTPLNLTNAADLKTVEAKLGKTGDWIQINQFFGGDGDNKPADKVPEKVIARLVQGGADVAVRLKGSETAWPSKEVKVKFTKQGKAPKLVVDTAKGMVNFKKGQEYRVKTKDAVDVAIEANAPWTDVSGKVALNGGDPNLGIDGTKFAKIQVRDKATAKKPASKITEVLLSKQDKVAVLKVTNTGELVTGKLKLVVKVPYDLKKGAYIENNTTDEYEVYIAPDGTAPTATAKWIKVKAGKTDKKKPNTTISSKTNLKYSTAKTVNTYGDDNSAAKIFVRLAGTKQNKVDGSVKLASANSDGQEFKLAADKGTFAKPTDTIAVPAKVKSETIKTENIEFSKLFKDGVAPKITVTQKVGGVTVKAEKLKKDTNGKGTGKLTIKVSKSAFKTKPTDVQTLKFKMSVEGEEKEFTVNITVS